MARMPDVGLELPSLVSASPTIVALNRNDGNQGRIEETND